MTIKESFEVLKLLKGCYFNHFSKMSSEDVVNMSKIWATMFKDYPLDVVLNAVSAMVKTLKYPPTIADVFEKITLLSEETNGHLSEMEAWSLVLKATSDSYYNAQKNFDSLPPILQKIVGTPSQLRNWGQLDVDTFNSVTQSNFIKSYRTMLEREKVLKLVNVGKDDSRCIHSQVAKSVTEKVTYLKKKLI